ncbi:MAG: DUF1679 domain-containing protein [Candidatus Schekmanbacteria bacterium]|nr:DUF1679 domain-containing protein [Candidatus Schekmanbacteria bacterium]
MSRLAAALTTPPPASRVALAVLTVLIWIGLAAAWLTTLLDRHVRRVKLPFPRNLEELRDRQDWCIARLRAAGAIPAGAAVRAFRATPFAAGEAFRSHMARIDLELSVDGTDRVFSCLAKFAPIVGTLRDHAVYVLQDNASKECGFYLHHAAEIADAAPRPFFAQAHKASGHLCVLLEHLAAADHYGEHDDFDDEIALLAIRQMARWHALHWGLQRASAQWVPAIPPVVIDYFARQFRGEGAGIMRRLMAMCWRQAVSGPQTLVHGDARIGNWLFADGRAVMIDWQAIRSNRAAWDVAYFIMLSLGAERRKVLGPMLQAAYHEELVAHGVSGYSLADLEEDCRYAEFLIFLFLSAPMLSGEASVGEGHEERLLREGLPWKLRVEAWLAEADYEWLASRSGIAAGALREAFLSQWQRGHWNQGFTTAQAMARSR